jgi:hypothetical protein
MGLLAARSVSMPALSALLIPAYVRVRAATINADAKSADRERSRQSNAPTVPLSHVPPFRKLTKSLRLKN